MHNVGQTAAFAMSVNGGNGNLRYVAYAAAATAAAAALYVAAARVSCLVAVFTTLGDDARRWVSFFYSRADIAADPGLWLKYALCFAVPAVLWAAALARLVPRVALRFAGLVAQKWFVYLIIVLSVAGVAYAAAAVLGDRALTYDESADVFQSKIFCRGKLAAPAPLTEGDLEHAFFRAKGELVRYGRWFSSRPPLHPALLCLGARAGWPKLLPVIAAAVILFATYAVGRRALGPFGGAIATILVAASPFFLFTQGSYLSEATFLCFFSLAVWACLRAAEEGTRGSLLALGLAAGAAFLVREYAALYLALPLGWFLWRRTRGRPGGGLVWFVAGSAPFVAAWLLYNWRQTGNLLLPPAFFSETPLVAFGDGYTFADALSSCARNLFVLSTDGFGWPLLCLVGAVARLFLKPRPDDFEKTLYGIVVLSVLARLPVRGAGIAYGATYYYPAWFCLAFITARFFVILGGLAQERFRGGGEGLAAFVLAALVALNVFVYLPRAAARYAGRPWGNYSLWADASARRALADLGISDAVVIIKPRDWCLSSAPGSPFLDDRVVFARDNGALNGELAQVFPGRDFYVLDYREFRRTGEITAWAFAVE
jgi:hypothetical protein